MRGPVQAATLSFMDSYTDEENELVTTKTTVTKLYTSIHINWYQYGEHTVSLNA